MKTSKIISFALGKAGDHPCRNLSALFCISFAVCAFTVLLGLSFGLEKITKERILGDMPNIIKAQPERFSLGPVNISNYIDQKTLDAIKKTDGVKNVFRISRLDRPSHLKASYMDQNFRSDILTEAADEAYIKMLCAKNKINFGSEHGTLECLLPASVIETVSSGISIHTHLPAIDAQVLVGHHFTIIIGKSGFLEDGKPIYTSRCRIAGISPLVGIGGPSIPYNLAEKLNGEPLKCTAVIIEAEDSQKLPDILSRLSELRLTVPGAEMAKQIGDLLLWMRIGITVFCILLSSCSGLALHAGISLEIYKNKDQLALFRALGASAADLVKIYAVRSFSLGAAGSLAGIFSGIIFGGMVNRYCMHIHLISETGSPLFLLTPFSASAAAALGIAAALIFGIYPIIKIASNPESLNISSLN